LTNHSVRSVHVRFNFVSHGTSHPGAIDMNRLTSNHSHLHPIALAAALAGMMGSAAADTVTWCNASSGYWDTSANWCPSAPTAASDALLGGANTEFRSGSQDLQSFVGTGQLTLSGGTLSPAQASSIGSLNMTGGTLAGAGALTVTGASTWSGGHMSSPGASSNPYEAPKTGSTTTFLGPLTLGGSGAGPSSDVRTINFAGTTTAQGHVTFDPFSTMNNTGTWLDKGFSQQRVSIFPLNMAGAAAFNNTGQYIKTGDNSSHISGVFNSTGSLQIQQGTFSLENGGANTGVVDVADGATLNLGSLTPGIGYTFSGSKFGTGKGHLVVYPDVGLIFKGDYAFAGRLSLLGSVHTPLGGTLISDGPLSLGSLEMGVASKVLVAGTLTVTGDTSWGAGRMGGAGITNLEGAVSLGSPEVDKRTLNFKGTTLMSNGGFHTSGGAKLHNAGTWLDQVKEGTVVVGGSQDSNSFTNSGTYVKSGKSTTDLSTIQYINTGVTIVQAGLIKLPANFVNTGTFKGNGAVQTNLFTNSGKVAPGESIGTLTITGDFAQTAEGELDIEVQSASLHDVLSVSGAATLGGTLALSCLADCSFQVGDTLRILDAAPDALTGTFSSVTYTGFGGIKFDVVYDRADGDVLLRAAAVPEPGAYALLTAALGMAAALRRRQRSQA
jgi:hypothetical protein